MLTFRTKKKLIQQVLKHRFFNISYNAVAISGQGFQNFKPLNDRQSDPVFSVNFTNRKNQLILTIICRLRNVKRFTEKTGLPFI